MNFNTQVKLNIYETIAQTASPPSSAEVAVSLAAPVDRVEAAFQELAKKRLLVLEPGSSSHIRMAPPFSGVETPFKVNLETQTYYANCVWDALGVPAALHRDGVVNTSCPDCGAAMTLQIRDGKPVPQDCAVHFAVPAAHWWDDIVYT
ncbi:MAG: organomercurial lyase [Anaerolineales bacterium]|nr:organomercurial lyase [Anaerolineales bacterium]